MKKFLGVVVLIGAGIAIVANWNKIKTFFKKEIAKKFPVKNPAPATEPANDEA